MLALRVVVNANEATHEPLEEFVQAEAACEKFLKGSLAEQELVGVGAVARLVLDGLLGLHRIALLDLADVAGELADELLAKFHLKRGLFLSRRKITATKYLRY